MSMKRFVMVILVSMVLPCYAISQLSQIDEISKISSGDFDVYSFDEKKKSKKSEKKWPVEFKTADTQITEVIVNRAGIIAEKYTPDLPEIPAYFKAEKEIVISVIDQRIYYYSYSIKTGSEIKYILTNKSIGKYED